MAEPREEAEELAEELLELTGRDEPLMGNRIIWQEWQFRRDKLARKIQAVIDKAKE